MFRRCVALGFSIAVCVLAGGSPVALASSSFGFKRFEVAITNRNGTPDTQAGSHPYAETFTFELNTELVPLNPPLNNTEVHLPGHREVKDINVNLPPGVIGDARAVPQCPRELFDGPKEPRCPGDTEVGEDTVGLAETTAKGLLELEGFPVYNLVPPPDVPAEFGFNENGIHGIIDVGVRPGSEQYGLTAHVYNVTQRFVAYNSTTIWGVPAEHGGESPAAFLTLPAACGGKLRFSISATSWQEPEAPPITASTETPAITGCESSPFGFGPSLSIKPDTSHAETPAGLTAEVTPPRRSRFDGGR